MCVASSLEFKECASGQFTRETPCRDKTDLEHGSVIYCLKAFWGGGFMKINTFVVEVKFKERLLSY